VAVLFGAAVVFVIIALIACAVVPACADVDR
jgi:hypothetical protein